MDNIVSDLKHNIDSHNSKFQKNNVEPTLNLDLNLIDENYNETLISKKYSESSNKNRLMISPNSPFV